MVRHAPHSAGADGQSEQDVDERVEHHQLCYAVDGLHGVFVGELVASAALLGEELRGLAPEFEEYEHVYDGDSEFAEEEPDVVQAEAFGLVVIADL